METHSLWAKLIFPPHQSVHVPLSTASILLEGPGLFVACTSSNGITSMGHDKTAVVADDVSSAGRDRKLIRRALLTFCQRKNIVIPLWSPHNWSLSLNSGRENVR